MPHRIHTCTNTLYDYAMNVRTQKKIVRYVRVNLLGQGPRLIKKEFTGPRSLEGWKTLLYSTVTTAHKRKRVEGRGVVLANTNTPYAEGIWFESWPTGGLSYFFEANLKPSSRVRCSSLTVGQSPLPFVEIFFGGGGFFIILFRFSFPFLSFSTSPPHSSNFYTWISQTKG